jgi:hypothetical protein
MERNVEQASKERIACICGVSIILRYNAPPNEPSRFDFCRRRASLRLQIDQEVHLTSAYSFA